MAIAGTAGIRAIALVVALAVVVSGCAALEGPPQTYPSAPSQPAAPPVDPIQQYADDRLSVMTLDQKIRSMIIAHLPGTDAAQLRDFAAVNGLGGLILMGDNIPDPSDLLAGMTPTMSAERGLPILLAIDQEGGVVRRIPSDHAPSAEELRWLAPEAARDAFASRSALIASLGISVNFGIVADVTGDLNSFIFDRSMGSTAADVAARVTEAVLGENGTVLSTLKHFPGHGVAPGDSHSSIPTTAMGMDEWRAGHEEPFAAGIAAGADLVMFGHLQFDAVDPEPATLSPLWHSILRDELGFDGIIVTDDMGMLQNSGRVDLADPYQNAVRAVAAGNTMLLYVGPVDVAGVAATIGAAVESGSITEAAIDDAARRILVARRILSGDTGRFVHCFEVCQSLIE